MYLTAMEQTSQRNQNGRKCRLIKKGPTDTTWSTNAGKIFESSSSSCKTALLPERSAWTRLIWSPSEKMIFKKWKWHRWSCFVATLSPRFLSFLEHPVGWNEPCEWMPHKDKCLQFLELFPPAQLVLRITRDHIRVWKHDKGGKKEEEKMKKKSIKYIWSGREIELLPEGKKPAACNVKKFPFWLSHFFSWWSMKYYNSIALTSKVKGRRNIVGINLELATRKQQNFRI